MQGKNILGLHRIYYGMFKGGIKGEKKGRDLSNLGMKKWRDKGIKRSICT